MDAILTLETLIKARAKIIIDGVEHELVAVEEFGLKEIAQIQRLGKDIMSKANRLAELTEEEADALDRGLDDLVKKILPTITEEILARLGFKKKIAVIQAFTTTVQAAPQAGTETKESAAPTEAPLTGDSPSEGSSASMEATPADGSTVPSGL